MIRFKKGFTLIEILIVVAVIGILATIITINIVGAQEKAKVSKAVTQVDTVKKAVKMYYADTFDWPSTCRNIANSSFTQCDNATNAKDPFLVANGVARWNGPYINGGIYNMAHPWGGDVGYWKDTTYLKIVLDEDAPGQDTLDNSGPIPDSALLKIDQLIDDGNLHTGSALQSTDGGTGYIGEIVYSFEQL